MTKLFLRKEQGNRYFLSGPEKMRHELRCSSRSVSFRFLRYFCSQETGIVRPGVIIFLSEEARLNIAHKYKFAEGEKNQILRVWGEEQKKKKEFSILVACNSSSEARSISSKYGSPF